jgi:hypothetical protein
LGIYICKKTGQLRGSKVTTNAYPLFSGSKRPFLTKN